MAKGYLIRMGIPEMKNLWDSLVNKNRDGSISKSEGLLYKKWGNALKHLSADPSYRGLQTHEIKPLSKRYGIKVWQSYLENRKSSDEDVLGIRSVKNGYYHYRLGTASGG